MAFPHSIGDGITSHNIFKSYYILSICKIDKLSKGHVWGDRRANDDQPADASLARSTK